MHLRDKEEVIKVFHHHPILFLWRAAKAVGASFPFFFLNFALSSFFSHEVNIMIAVAIIIMFSVILFYDQLIYFLDALYITNMRIVHVDWIDFFTKKEIEALIDDIQDMETKENGFLSGISWLDFGTFELETASTRTSVVFEGANNPEGIKHFIYSLSKEHGDITTFKITPEFKECIDKTSEVGVEK